MEVRKALFCLIMISIKPIIYVQRAQDHQQQHISFTFCTVPCAASNAHADTRLRNNKRHCSDCNEECLKPPMHFKNKRSSSNTRSNKKKKRKIWPDLRLSTGEVLVPRKHE